MNRKMPTKSQILNYWQTDFTVRKYWHEFYTQSRSLPADRICFACGCYSGTERAHITAKVNGGDDTVENLHLLCKHCHIESESFEGEVYNKWFVWKTPQTSGSWQMLENKTAFVMTLSDSQRAIVLRLDLRQSD